MRRRYGRSIFAIVLLAGVAAFTGLWYTAAGRSTPDTPEFGGEYIEGMAGAPLRVNPLFAQQNSADQALASLVFAGLTRLDEHGSPVPDLAETWSVSQDGRTYTFLLRAGLVWHDNVELNADDVVFTYEALQAQGLRGPADLMRVLSGATMTKVDSRTVTISLPQAFSPLPAYLTLGILPKHLLSGVSAVDLYDSQFNQHPIGAGPYRLEELTPGRALLAANPAYQRGQPFVQHVELRFFRDDGEVLSALKEGQIQAALLTTPLSEADQVYLERRRDLSLTILTTTETDVVYLNLEVPLFQELRLRQALLYALDRDALVKGVLEGMAVRADSPISPGSWAYAGSLGRYGPDPAAAATLLEEAGWRLGSDGVRTKNGRRLTFTLDVSSDPLQVAVANAVAERWKAVGVAAQVEPSGSTTLIRDTLEPRDFEAALFPGITPADPDPYPAWHSSQSTGKGGNLSGWDDDRIDKLLEEARTAGQPRRKELYAEFQEQFAQQVPSLPLFTTTQLYVQPSSLKGSRVGLAADSGARFWQVQEWYLKTK